MNFSLTTLCINDDVDVKMPIINNAEVGVYTNDTMNDANIVDASKFQVRKAVVNFNAVQQHHLENIHNEQAIISIPNPVDAIQLLFSLKIMHDIFTHNFEHNYL